VLEGHIKQAHTQSALASGFGHTYWWVLGVTLVALLPTLLLARIERRARQQEAPVFLPDEAPMLEAA
jgi:hypothetical protein